MNNEPIYLSYDYTPMAHQSVKFGKNGAYQPKHKTERKLNLAWSTLEQLRRNYPDHKPFDCAIEIVVIHTFPALKNFSRKQMAEIESGKVVYKDTRPDVIDNLNKLLSDALTGLLYTDDGRIAKATVEKRYGLTGKIEVWCKTM